MPQCCAGSLDLSNCHSSSFGIRIPSFYEEVLPLTRRIFKIPKEMKITQALLDNLTAQAKASPRLRMNYDLRNSADDQSQRMLNAIEPGSPLPIHRHKYTSETVVCLRGRIVEEYYDDLERMCTEAIELTPNGPVVALNIPAGQWHTIKSLESGTVILEVKDGPYEPLGDEDILA